MPVAADDPRLARCGFAKLSGDGGKLDVVIRKYEVLLGRPSKGKDVDVPLEGHKAVSREHARIRYNFGTSERVGGAGRWRQLPGAAQLPVAPACCNAPWLTMRRWITADAYQQLGAAGASACIPTSANRRGCLWHSAAVPQPCPAVPAGGPLRAAEQFELEVLGKNGVRVSPLQLATACRCRAQRCPAARSPPAQLSMDSLAQLSNC